ncbi:MAG: DUF4105 domain-containing protein, partial [Alphaproteobacteria bacterium]|nr:DUF4105 domain-containing protein [Alphaproteobacteria bacterium]
MRLIFIFLFLIPALVFAQSPIEQATQKELWKDPHWQALLHYKKGESTIDSKAFFNATMGKTDPKAELIATLKAFAQPAEKEHIEKIQIKADITQDFQYQHAQCAFPARYAWLKSKLDLSSLPKQKCSAYQKWLKKVQPHQATLVFASAYLNQPSSLFGHTFLRFDRKSKNEDLLSYISNFGAITPPNPNGFAYAYNGLTGGYPGVFSFQPYYEKVKTYGAIENRDLWEYPLNLTQKELDTLVAHVWELGYQYVDYYFFTDNCSYLLMEVLDAVRPQMKLADKFPRQTIPLDTVRVALAEKGLVGTPDFRASMQTKILSHWKDLSTKEKNAVHEFRRDGNLSTDLTEKETARVAEVAYDAMQYDLAKGKISVDVMRPRAMALLRARNKVAETNELFPPIKTPLQPDVAHQSARVTLSGGVRDDHEILSLSLRPAYHTIDDLDDGYVFGAGLNFFYGDVHYDLETDDFYLNQFDLVSITSLSPWQATFRPTSWKLGVRLD